LDSEFEEWCCRPSDKVAARDVRVLAVDTSDTASGGGEFVADNKMWKLSEDGMMVTELEPHQVGKSSTLRECKGCVDVDQTCVPDACTKAVVLCDNQATVSVMKNGSSIPELNACAVVVFKRALRNQRVLHFRWIGREQPVIAICDRGSRMALTADVATPPEIFWRAESEARRLFGRGFQYDRFASEKTVCPPGTAKKLLFDSEYRAPGAAARDAMTQYWLGFINWVAPPFVLLDQVLDLMVGQGVAGAVMVPFDSRAGHAWAHRIREGDVGVKGFFTYRPAAHAETNYAGRYAIVFLDYRRQGDPVSTAPTASQCATMEGGGAPPRC
jgi:hypothetical protein